MRFHPFLLGLAACATWLAGASAALATTISNPLYEEPPVFFTHLSAGPLLFARHVADPVSFAHQAGSAMRTEATAAGGTAIPAVLSAIPTSALPEPATYGLFLLGAGSLLFLKFQRRKAETEPEA